MERRRSCEIWTKYTEDLSVETAKVGKVWPLCIGILSYILE